MRCWEHGTWMRIAVCSNRSFGGREQRVLVKSPRSGVVRRLIPDEVDGFEENVKQLRAELAKSASEGKAGLEEDDKSALYFGAMLYRLGQYDDAVSTLAKLPTKLDEGPDQNGQYAQACAEYFLAMTRHQLGHEYQARRWLDQARSSDDSLQGNPNLPWFQRVALNTLRREAKGLIEP